MEEMREEKLLLRRGLGRRPRTGSREESMKLGGTDRRGEAPERGGTELSD